MKKTALLLLLFGCVSSPLMAKPHHSHYYSRNFSHHETQRHHESRRYAYHRQSRRHHESRRYAYHHGGDRHHSDHPAGQQTHSHITCDMVRSYVAQVGLAQAKAMAEAAGMTASEERRARQCLLRGV